MILYLINDFNYRTMRSRTIKSNDMPFYDKRINVVHDNTADEIRRVKIKLLSE